ncbi:MAG: hypothetical protein ACLR8Y_00185 [Alistipes indistinctus]
MTGAFSRVLPNRKRIAAEQFAQGFPGTRHPHQVVGTETDQPRRLDESPSPAVRSRSRSPRRRTSRRTAGRVIPTSTEEGLTENCRITTSSTPEVGAAEFDLHFGGKTLQFGIRTHHRNPVGRQQNIVANGDMLILRLPRWIDTMVMPLRVRRSSVRRLFADETAVGRNGKPCQVPGTS